MSLPHLAHPGPDEPSRAGPRDIDWRWALPRIALVFLATRLLVLGVAVAVELTQPEPPAGVRADDRPIIASLTAWDGVYYLGIAADGYHADPRFGPDYAFYPAYPLLVRAASVLTFGDVGLAAVLVANVAFALALVVLYALSVRHLTPERAVLSLWFLALAPGAIAYSLTYSEGLLLLFAAGAFLAAESGRPWLAGLALLAATLGRVPGILLVLPMLLLFIQRDGLRPTRAWLALCLPLVAVLAWFGYLWWLTGDPWATMSAQRYWEPVEGSGSTAVNTGGREGMGIGIAPQLVTAGWLSALLFYAFLFVFFRHDRVRPAYWLVAILGLASIFLAGRLQSAPRYLAVAWPFDWVLASRESRLGRAIVLVVFAVFHVVALWLAFTWSVPP